MDFLLSRTYKFLVVFFVILITLLNNSLAQDDIDEYYYFGLEAGVSSPVVKVFKDTENDSSFRLGSSTMFGFRAGYSFYPGMMIELSATHQPSYGFKYDILKTIVEDDFSGSTKTRTDVTMISIIYALQNEYYGFKPYFTAGAGIAKVTIKPSKGSFLGEALVFKVEKNNINCLTYQFGLGVTKELTKNIALDLSLKLQIIKDIEFKYNSFDIISKVKKSPAAGEFALGLIYKIPVK